MRLRNTSTPGRTRPASDSGSPGTASANASSTSTTRPGRRSARTSAAGCSTPVGFVGLPTTTRSASAGTASGCSRWPSRASVSTCTTGTPAARSAGSGSVNPGCTTAASRGRSAGSRANPSAPAGEHQHLVGTAAVPGGDGRPGGGVVRGGGIAAQIGEGGGEPVAQPPGRAGALHVDREVEQAGRGIDVAVVAQALPGTGTNVHNRRA